MSKRRPHSTRTPLGFKAFLPERGKKKFPSIVERARWFAERAGSLSDAASLGRVERALSQARNTPSATEDTTTVLRLASSVANAAYSDVRDAKALLFDGEGSRLDCRLCEHERKSIGTCGPAIDVKSLEAPTAHIAIWIDPDEAKHLDLETARLVRRSRDGLRVSIIEASGFAPAEHMVLGRVTEPGRYEVVALPRHPWLKLAIETLCLHWPWVRVQPSLSKLLPAKTPPMLDRICQLILCAPEFMELGRDGKLVELGLGFPPPDLPPSLGGDVCEMCLGKGLDLPKLDSGRLYEPPELQICRLPRRRCEKWRSVGPVPGDGFWGIGRVSQIDVHPTDGDVLIAACAGGGVWRTDDGGEHWRPLMQDEPTLTMGAVAFAPSQPNVIYAASGEDGGGFDPAWPGVGIYRSTDGGSTWTLMTAVTSTRFSALVIHPQDPQTFYAAGDRGLHKSVDGGETWVTNPGLASLFDAQISDVVIAHDAPDRVYVGVRNDGVYRSTTAGEATGATPAFTRLDGPAQLPSNATAAWTKLAIGRDANNNGSSFLAAKMGVDGSRIFTTTDGGTIWTEQAVGVASISFDEWASLIAVDPSNESVLYAGAARELKRSDDGGATWTSINTGVHPDQQDLVFDPANANRVYLANDGGVYRSPDQGENWFFASTGMSTSQLYDVDISQRDRDVVVCGSQDNGIFYRTTSRQWRHLPFRWDGTQAAVDPTDPDIIYFSGQNGIDNANLSRSVDGGVTVDALGTGGLSGGSPWVTLIKLDPTDPVVAPENNRVMFACGSNQIFRSTDAGATWQRVEDGAGIPFNSVGVITSMEFAPSSPDILYLGTAAGALYRAVNGGASSADWSRIDTPGAPADALFPNTTIGAIAINPNDENRVWITFAGTGVTYSSRPDAVVNPLGISHAFRTVDGGATWEDASGQFDGLNLPDVPTSAIVVDDRNPDTAFVGTDVGVFRTSDGGTTWTAFQEGLARAPISELRLHRSSRTLTAATMGRGIWERRLV